MIIYRGATVLRVKWEGCPQGPQAWGFLEESRLWTLWQLRMSMRLDMTASRQCSFFASVEIEQHCYRLPAFNSHSAPTYSICPIVLRSGRLPGQMSSLPRRVW
jgi:hypothetical protein